MNGPEMNLSPVKPGDLLASKYRVDKLLGMGAMGVVVAATHVALQQRVALKFMLPGKPGGEEQYARFLREARAAAHLKTQHVARVSDVGTLESGAPYMAMELLDGCDLEALLRERGPLPIAEAVDYVLQACEAVAEAHACGIIHRDLKPANLFLTTGIDGRPCVKVLDFGVSKHSNEVKLTQTEAILGSPLYMSPEQIKASASVDPRSDVWALGVVLYELIAGPGMTPFSAQAILELVTKIHFEPPTPLTTHRPDAPPMLEALLAQCFEKDRDRRVPSVAALAAALVPFGTEPFAAIYAQRVAAVLGEQIAPARPTAVLVTEAGSGGAHASGAVPAIGTATANALARSSVTAPASSGRAWVFVAGVLALGTVAVGGFWVGRGRTTPSASPSSVAAVGSTATATSSAPDVAPTHHSEPPAEQQPPVDAATSTPTATASSSATIAATPPQTRTRAAQPAAPPQAKTTKPSAHAQPPPAANPASAPEGPRK